MAKIGHDIVEDESGATAIEYGLIAAGVSVAIVTVVYGLGTDLTSVFDGIRKTLVPPKAAAPAG
ncbi:MAG: Flp family type IVb pilin [Alphaproteobacteria bacterium]